MSISNHMKAVRIGKERALEALRNAIKDCAICAPASAIVCKECEARYVAALRKPDDQDEAPERN